MELNDRFFGFSDALTHISQQGSSNQSGATNHLLAYLERSRYKNRRIGLSTRLLGRMATECVSNFYKLLTKPTLFRSVIWCFQHLKTANEKNKAIAFFADVHASFGGRKSWELSAFCSIGCIEGSCLGHSGSFVLAVISKSNKAFKKTFWCRLILWCASVGVAQNLSKVSERVFSSGFGEIKIGTGHIYCSVQEISSTLMILEFWFWYKKEIQVTEGHFVSMLSQSEIDLIQSFTHVFSVNVVDKNLKSNSTFKQESAKNFWSDCDVDS